MTGGILAYGLLAALAIALLVAAATDLRARRIDNWLTLGIALAAPLFWWATGLSPWPGMAIQLGLGLGIFAITAGIFALGMMGGGDVKLMAALALWLPPAMAFKMLFLMGIIGGAMSIHAGARNLALTPAERGWRVLAIAATALWIAGSVYVARVLMGAPPADFAALAAGFASPALGKTLVYGGLVAALLTTVAGALLVSRRQRDRAEVPYGLAISVAALCVLAATWLPRGAQIAGT